MACSLHHHHQRHQQPGIITLSLLGMLTLFTRTVHVSCECTFAEPYRGSWYQKGLGDVIIRHDAITTKGKCLEQENDKFYMQDTEMNCRRCLLILKRHHNILQYKESYCSDHASLEAACYQIRVEDMLYTLVRDNSVPISCPFRNDYHLVYKNGSRDFCDEPQSELKTCASDSKLHFRFRHCEDVPNTFDTDLDLRCLATWKDGSALYVYGSFRGKGVVSRDYQYRCFIYEELGNEVHISMSADANCWGLTSPQDGELVLQLTTDEDGSDPDSGCRYPDWLVGKHWRDLSGRHVYDLSPNNSTLRKYRQRDLANGHAAMAFSCAHAQATATEGKNVTVISRVTKGCSSHYQCLQLVKVHSNVIQLYTGVSGDSTNINCHGATDHNTTGSSHTLYADASEPTPCPWPGKFVSTTAISDCMTNLHVGCNTTSVISMDDSCNQHPGGSMECLYHWSAGPDKTRVLTRRLGDSSNITNCFVMDRSNTMTFHTDPQCNTHVDHIFNTAIRLDLEPQTGACGELPSSTPPITEPAKLFTLCILAVVLQHVVRMR